MKVMVVPITEKLGFMSSVINRPKHEQGIRIIEMKVRDIDMGAELPGPLFPIPNDKASLE